MKLAVAVLSVALACFGTVFSYADTLMNQEINKPVPAGQQGSDSRMEGSTNQIIDVPANGGNSQSTKIPKKFTLVDQVIDNPSPGGNQNSNPEVSIGNSHASQVIDKPTAGSALLTPPLDAEDWLSKHNEKLLEIIKKLLQNNQAKIDDYLKNEAKVAWTEENKAQIRAAYIFDHIP